MSRFGAFVLLAAVASAGLLAYASSSADPVLVKFDVMLDKENAKEGSFTVEVRDDGDPSPEKGERNVLFRRPCTLTSL